MYKLALALALGTAAAVDVTDVKAWHAANGGSDPTAVVARVVGVTAPPNHRKLTPRVLLARGAVRVAL